MRLRDYTPRGYKSRHILILIVPMIIFVVTMTLYFFSNHVRDVNAKLSRSVAREISLIIEQRKNDPGGWDDLVAGLQSAELMRVRFFEGERELVPPVGRKCCGALGQEMRNQVGGQFAYAANPDGMMTLRVLTEDGVLEAVLDRKRVVIITAHIFIVWTLVFCAFLLATSYAFLRNQVRSIMQLAHAADAFGRGEDAPEFRPSGAREVRQAARSIMRMRNRILRYTDQRAAMLAGVSHDLRTPLTRLKLELSMVPKEIDLSAAKTDIKEMEEMLEGYLAFARGEEAETSVETDLTALATDACAAARERAEIEVESPYQVVLRLRPMSMKRAITNLVNNAADYGDKVRVRVSRDGQSAIVEVEDDGPGIPAEQREDAFRPFSRLDVSRNQNLSGVGLGLTIARDAARSHGGDVTLGESSMGGLKATIRIPLDPDSQKRLEED